MQANVVDVVAPVETCAQPPNPAISWWPSSPDLLAFHEMRVLSRVRSPWRIMNVPIPHLSTTSESEVAQLNTLEIVPVIAKGLDAPDQTDKPVLLVMHGMGCGFGVFNKNLDALAEEYHVFAIDILGFGGSSRVSFPKSQDGSAAENLFVEAIHAWKQQMGFKKIVVCGHSFGGYLATCFALRYPEEASALMLIDPWGFPEMDKEAFLQRPLSRRMLNQVLFGMVKPVTLLRCLGPLGPSTFHRMRQHVVGSKHDPSEREMMLTYLYHANAHARGTGAGRPSPPPFVRALLPCVRARLAR